MTGILCNNECVSCDATLIHTADARSIVFEKIHTILPIFTSGEYPEAIEDVVAAHTPTPVICTDCYVEHLTSISAKSDTGRRSLGYRRDWTQCCNCGEDTQGVHVACQVSEMHPRELESHMINGSNRTLISADPSGGEGYTVCLECMSQVMVDAAEGSDDARQPLTSLFIFAEQMDVWNCDREMDEMDEYNKGWYDEEDEEDPTDDVPF